MKNLCKNTLIIFGLLLSVSFYSCQDKDTSLNLDDASLATALEESIQKKAIDESELPAEVIATIDQKYINTYINIAYKDNGLGYIVTMRQSDGEYVGEMFKAYFNLHGKELITSNETQKPTESQGFAKYYDILFPLSYTMPDGTSITIENDKDWTAIKHWYKANPNTKDSPNIQYPYKVRLSGGKVLNIEKEADMDAIKANTPGYKKPAESTEGKGFAAEDCYRLIYPLVYVMPDGSSITLNDKKDWNIIIDWYSNNNKSKTKPSLQFPVKVMLEKGITKTLNSNKDLDSVISYCSGDKTSKSNVIDIHQLCFKLKFPISFTMPDESIINLEDLKSWSLIKDWYIANPKVTKKQLLNFPVTVILQGGAEQVIENVGDFISANDLCKRQRSDNSILPRNTKKITKPIVHPKDCKFPVSGEVTYYYDNVIVSILDYGDGTCDNIATKTEKGVTHEIKL